MSQCTRQQASTLRIGLQGLRERIESIGGEFDINSTAGAGTRLTMTLSTGD